MEVRSILTAAAAATQPPHRWHHRLLFLLLLLDSAHSPSVQVVSVFVPCVLVGENFRLLPRDSGSSAVGRNGSHLPHSLRVGGLHSQDTASRGLGVELQSIEPALRADTEDDHLREDVPEQFENREAIISSIPTYEELFIRVPKVLNKE